MTKLPPIQPLPFTLQRIALDDITRNPNNPRKIFDPAKLKELAAGIKVNGILQPPAVRPLPGGKYILIWGERRTRAAADLDLEEIEVKVYDVDEVKAAELALIENDDREDLTPLERAEGYLELQEKHGLTLDQIAAQVGRPKSTVHSALQLVKLIPGARTELESGELKTSIAELIGAVPQPGHQAEILELAMGRTKWGKKPPLKYDEVKELIRSEYSLQLNKAPFDLDDPGLTLAGACTTCPKRTEGPLTGSSCLDRSCNAQKVTAFKRKVVAEAKEKHQPVLSAGESKKALAGGYYGTHVKLTDVLAASGKGKVTVASAIGALKEKLEPQLAVSETGRLVKVLKKSDVKRALKAQGLGLADSSALDAPTPSSTAPVSKEDKEAAEKQRAEREAAELLHKKVAQAAIGKVVEFIEKKGLSGDLLRLVVAKVVRSGHSREAYERRGLKLSEHWPQEKDFFKHFGSANDREVLGMLFEICDEEITDCRQGEYSSTLAQACEHAGVSLSEIEEDLAPPTTTKADEQGWVCKKGCGKPYGEHAGLKCPPMPKATKKKRLANAYEDGA